MRLVVRIHDNGSARAIRMVLNLPQPAEDVASASER
jgi:hypothetical protein